MKQYPNDRAFTNDGQFFIVETQAPGGYFGDWTDVAQPGASGSDLGKRAYYLRLTGDGSTITLDNAAYNADILTENQGGVLVETPDGTVTVQIYGEPKNATRTYEVSIWVGFAHAGKITQLFDVILQITNGPQR